MLANIKPARYLEAGNPTGLTGVYTHGSPRSSLLYLYGTTLDKLKAAPESSLYRQSVEALTKHRMAIVAAAHPPGWEEWNTKIQKIKALYLSLGDGEKHQALGEIDPSGFTEGSL